MRRSSIAATCLSLALAAAATPAAAAPPPIKHVWVLQLENKSYDDSFVKNLTNQYLWRTLPLAGELLRQYYGTGHASLDNYITQLSGQAPNADTQADCQNYVDVTPGIPTTDGQVLGQGCVYPPSVKTLVDQLEAKGLTWKGYMEDMGNDPSREPATCGNPPPNAQDPTQSAAANDQYAARHNPFVYFHSILDPPGRCAAHVGPLPPLASDLAAVDTTPNFSYITPNLCNDGHDATPCAGDNAKGTKEGGLIAADAFLAKWVPVIMGSPAFQQDGMLLITFDESDVDDAVSCCGEPAGFNTPFPGISGAGGGRTGAVVLSRYVQPGSTNDTPYNHYSLLKSLEQVFGISEYLGYAAAPQLTPFGDDVYNRPDGGPITLPGPLRPGDAGSTGTATKLSVRIRLSRPTRLRTLRKRLLGTGGFAVRVTVKGTDRAMDPVRLRLVRRVGKTTVAVARTKARALPTGKGTLRVHLARTKTGKLKKGSYRLVAEVLHEDEVAARATASFTVH